MCRISWEVLENPAISEGLYVLRTLKDSQHFGTPVGSTILEGKTALCLVCLHPIAPACLPSLQAQQSEVAQRDIHCFDFAGWVTLEAFLCTRFLLQWAWQPRMVWLGFGLRISGLARMKHVYILFYSLRGLHDLTAGPSENVAPMSSWLTSEPVNKKQFNGDHAFPPNFQQIHLCFWQQDEKGMVWKSIHLPTICCRFLTSC